MFARSRVGCLALVICSVAASTVAMEALAQAGGGEQPLATALDRRANFSFEHVHLQDVVQSLRHDFKIDIRLDERALTAVSVQPDKTLVLRGHKLQMERVARQLATTLDEFSVQLPADANVYKQIRQIPYPGISFQQRDVTLRSALTHLLADFQPPLTYVVQDNILWITTPETAATKLVTRVYPVGEDLAMAPTTTTPGAESPFEAIPRQEEVARFDYEPLLDILHKTIAPSSWDEEGGRGAVHAGDGSLTVTQMSENQELVAGLLAALRKVRAEMQKQQPSYNPIPVGPSDVIAQRDADIDAALGRPANFDYQKVTLADVATDLSKRFGIAVRLDRHALSEVSTAFQKGVTFQQQNVSLLAGLEMMLNQLDPTLTYSIDHEVLLITTREAAVARPRIVVYPVRDIISAAVTAADATKRPDLWDFDSLVENIEKNIGPESWDAEGGAGRIAADYVARALVISQAEGAHHQIARLIADLRKLAVGRPKVEKVKLDVKQDADPFVTVVFRLWQPYQEKAVAKEEDLMKVVREMVQPQSWNAPEVQVRTLPSRLIIRQRVSVQRQIYAALQSLAVIKPEEPAAAQGKGGGFGGFGGGGLGGASGGASGGLGGQSGGFQGAGALPGAGK